MEEVSILNTREQMNYLKKLTVRAWWADGLWDFAMSGFFALLALFFYYFTYISAFPLETWPWPFNLQTANNSIQHITLAWILGNVIVMAAYAYLAYLLVKQLKIRWIAPITGDVRHSFWVSMDTKTILIYLGLYISLSIALIFINQQFAGGARLYSVYVTTAPAAIFFAIGQGYWLRRYTWISIIGFFTCVIFEWFLTSNATHTPLNFWDVQAQYGNPAIPLLIWTIFMVISGVSGLILTLRGNDEQQ